MKRKPNFWILIRKIKPISIMPYILAFMFWKHSNLNARETGIIIAASVTCYVLIMMATDTVTERRARIEKRNI